MHIMLQKGFAYGEVNIFCIRVSLKFESKLVEVIHSDLRLVNTGCDCMVAVLGYFDPVTGLWKFKVLYEVYCALKLFADSPFSLSFYGALAGKPVWKGRGRSSTCSRTIYGVDLHAFLSGHYCFVVWAGRDQRADEAGAKLDCYQLLRLSKTMSKASLKNRRLRTFTTDDLAVHNKKDDCWIVRNGRVYDVSAFVEDHPGGDDLILQYAGNDIGEAMDDPEEHAHSASAYDMLDEYLIGKLGKDALVVDESEQRSFFISHVSNHLHRLGG